MSQESEDYITPIFPVTSEEEIEQVENDSTESMDDFDENEFTMLGGAARRLWPTVEQYKAKFLGMFGVGYSSSFGKTYLPVLSLSDLVPNVYTVNNTRAKLPTGDNKSTTLDILLSNKLYIPASGSTPATQGYEIKELKKTGGSADFADYLKIFPATTATTPVFYLSVFLTKALEKAIELSKKATIPPEEKDTLLLLGEIIVRLYILCYINIFTQNDFCVEKPTKFSLYNLYVGEGMNRVAKFSEFLGGVLDDLEDPDSGIKLCLFGKDTALKERKAALEGLYDLLKDYGMIYFFNDVLNVKYIDLKEYSKTYFFENMKDFLEKMKGEAEKSEAAAAAAAAAAKRNKNEKDSGKKHEEACKALKTAIDKLPEEKRKALTDGDIASLTDVPKEYKKKETIQECFDDYDTLFPAGQYGFAAAVPAADICEHLKKEIDAKITTPADRLKITEAQIKTFMKPDGKTSYTKAEVETCFTNKTLFPDTQYKLIAAAAAPVSSEDCKHLKTEINSKIPPISEKTTPDKKIYIIKPEQVPSLKHVKTGKLSFAKSYTEEEIKSCLADTALFPPAEYKLLPVITDGDIKLVKDLIGQSPLLPNIPISFLNESLKKESYKKFNLDFIKAALDTLNLDLKEVVFKIDETEKPTETKEYESVPAEADGWCFYNSIVRQLDDKQENKVEKVRDLAAVNPTALAKKIKEYINLYLDPARKKEIESLYNVLYGKGKFAQYLNDLDNPSKKIWADPDFGIGLGTAYVTNNNIHIYKKGSGPNEYIPIFTYTVEDAEKALKKGTVSAPGKPSSGRGTLKLLYVNKNHYDILWDKSAAASSSSSSSAEASSVSKESIAAQKKIVDDMLGDYDLIITSLNDENIIPLNEKFKGPEGAATKLRNALQAEKDKITKLLEGYAEKTLEQKREILGNIDEIFDNINGEELLGKDEYVELYQAHRAALEKELGKFQNEEFKKLIDSLSKPEEEEEEEEEENVPSDKWEKWYTDYGDYVLKAMASFAADANTVEKYLLSLTGVNKLTDRQVLDLKDWVSDVVGKGTSTDSRVNNAKVVIARIKEKLTKEPKEKIELDVKLLGDSLFEMNKALAKLGRLVKGKGIVVGPSNVMPEVNKAISRIEKVAKEIPELRLEGNAMSKASNAAGEPTPYMTDLLAIGATGDYSEGTLGEHISTFVVPANARGGAKSKGKNKGSRKNRKQDRKTRKASRGRNTRRKNRKA